MIKETNRRYVGVADNTRREAENELHAVRSNFERLREEARRFEIRKQNLISKQEVNIAVLTEMLEKVGDDYEARHYLEEFRLQCIQTLENIKALDVKEVM